MILNPRYPFHKLTEPGQSFRVRKSDQTSGLLTLKQSLKAMAYRWGKRLNRTFDVTEEEDWFRVTFRNPLLQPPPKKVRLKGGPALEKMSKKAQAAFGYKIAATPLRVRRRVSIGNKLRLPRPATHPNWVIEDDERYSIELTNDEVILTRRQ